MLTRKKVKNIIRLTAQILTLVDEIMSIDMSYDQHLLYLEMFAEFLKDQERAAGKTGNTDK